VKVNKKKIRTTTIVEAIEGLIQCPKKQEVYYNSTKNITHTNENIYLSFLRFVWLTLQVRAKLDLVSSSIEWMIGQRHTLRLLLFV
jgi:hypothetical protein